MITYDSIDLDAMEFPIVLQTKRRGIEIDRRAAGFFLERVEEKQSGCWDWKLRPGSDGYGIVCLWRNGKSTYVLAHRLSYTLLVGEIPSGYQIDHLCRNRLCVNPAHLEPVTQGDNLRRAWAHRKACEK